MPSVYKSFASVPFLCQIMLKERNGSFLLNTSTVVKCVV